MSTSRLPIGHPLTKINPADLSPFDVADLLVSHRRGWSGGLLMKEPDGDPDEDLDEDPDDDPDEDPDAADPDSTVKVGDRTFKVSELQTIMAREKRQGRKSGRNAVLKELGFDSIEDLKAKLAAAGGDDPDDNAPADDKAKAAAAQRDREVAERERKAAERERRADLRAALAEAGARGDDLDDAYALLDRKVDREYDEDDLTDEVETLMKRRPALFGKDSDDDTDPKPKPRGNLPTGTPRRKAKPQSVFGARGLALAEQRFGKKK